MKKIFIPIFICLCLIAYIVGYSTTTTTTNLLLVKPASEDETVDYFDTVNANMDLIDAIFNTVSLTEFGYLDGVTSAIQTQLGLRYLKTEIDAETEMEAIWGVGLAHSGANSDITSLTGLTTPLAANYGGTGIVNNAAETITIGGAGTYALTLTLTNTTNVTLPTSGTVLTNAANTIDSDQYVDASIDHEHLAPDVISGLTDVTSADADYMMIWDATDSALKKVDMAEVRGAGGGLTEDEVEAYIFDADAESITGVWEVQDDIDLVFGNDANWAVNYDESVDDQLLFITAGTGCTATTDPMFEIIVGATPTANQEVFGVAKGTQASNTALFTLDEDGDASIAGTLGVTGQITGNLTGNVTGNASGSAATVTGATQASITTCANLVSIGTVTTGVWNATTIKANYLQSAAADLGAANIDINLGNTNGSYVTNLTTDGTITATVGFAGALTGNVTGNCSGTAATVTGAAQASITSLGTLTALAVDNISIDTNTVSSTAGDINISPLAGEDVVIDANWEFDGSALNMLTKANAVITAYAGENITIESVTIDAGVVAGITSLTADNIVNNTGILPDANDGAYIGAAGTAFQDLFLAEGGVINWDSSDFTLTQTGNTLNLAGGEFNSGANTIGSTMQTLTGDGSDDISWKLGNKMFFTFGAANETFTFTAPSFACNLVLVLKQDATGSRTVTWPATVLFPGGTHPTLTTGANLIDIVCLFWDGTSYYSMAGLDFK